MNPRCEDGRMWTTIALIWAICGIGGAVIAQMKGRQPIEGFGLGIAFGVIGVAVESLLPAGMPTAPEGMFANQCNTCNAIQNVSYADPGYDCWRCGRHHTFDIDDD